MINSSCRLVNNEGEFYICQSSHDIYKRELLHNEEGGTFTLEDAYMLFVNASSPTDMFRTMEIIDLSSSYVVGPVSGYPGNRADVPEDYTVIEPCRPIAVSNFRRDSALELTKIFIPNPTRREREKTRDLIQKCGWTSETTGLLRTHMHLNIDSARNAALDLTEKGIDPWENRDLWRQVALEEYGSRSDINDITHAYDCLSVRLLKRAATDLKQACTLLCYGTGSYVKEDILQEILSHPSFHIEYIPRHKLDEFYRKQADATGINDGYDDMFSPENVQGIFEYGGQFEESKHRRYFGHHAQTIFNVMLSGASIGFNSRYPLDPIDLSSSHLDIDPLAQIWLFFFENFTKNKVGVCRQCGDIFIRDRKTRMYCSDSCKTTHSAQKHQSETGKGR